MQFESSKQTLKHFASGISIPSMDSVTAITKTIRFKANAVSSVMDKAGGGCLKHGGFHRLYGGHDISCIVSWKKYGWTYGKELGKDFLTPNGLPYPKLQFAVRKGIIKSSTAQKYGTWNVGETGSAIIGIVDTAFLARKFSKDRDAVAEHWKSQTFKGAVKIAVGINSGNIPLVAAGITDCSLIAMAKIEKLAEIDLSETSFSLVF